MKPVNFSQQVIRSGKLAMRKLSWVWTNRWPCSKVIGIGFLIAYYCIHAFYVDWFWVTADLGIGFGICVFSVVFFFPNVERINSTSSGEDELAVKHIINEVKRVPFRSFLLLPGEDGFFFVPLLSVGITAVTATVAAAFFAAAHYPLYSLKNCVVKFVFIFCTAVIVLPLGGLGSVIVAHLIADGISIIALTFILKGATVPSAAGATSD
jgi:hypothetical protein